MTTRTIYVLTLLLLVQSMSAALHVLPAQLEFEDEDIASFDTSSRSNNSTSGCGYNTSMFYLSGWYSPMPAYAGDTVNATVFTDCNMLNQTMTVYYSISNSSTYLASGNWSWTALSLNETHHVEVTNMPAGTYILAANVYYGSNYTYLTSYNMTITVLTNSTGGGTGSNTGCGYNTSMFYLSGWYSPMPAYAGDTVNATVFTDCNMLNETMTVYYSISNSSTYFAGGNWSWTAMNLNETHHVEVSNIPAGTYVLAADVYYGSSYTYLGSYNTTITVLTNSTGGGTGNNTVMESIDAWTNFSNHNSSDIINLVWSASNLVWNMSINYNVTVDVYGHNVTTNTTSIVWSMSSTFSPTSSSYNDVFSIPANTLSTSCYYASFNLSDDDNGMFFDNVGFQFGVNMVCGSSGGNNTGGNNSGGNNTGGNNSMGGSQSNPIMPTNCSRIDWNLTVNVTINDCLNGTNSFWFELQNTGGIVWIDPDVAVGYDYIVYGGPNITGVNIPVGYGDNIFDLFLYDSVTGWYDTGTNIDAGITHTFNPPTDRMSIRGIEASEMLDPTDPTAFVSGLMFESNGTVVMTMTPVVTNYTSVCGDEHDLTTLTAWTNNTHYPENYDSIPAYYSVNCSVNGEFYMLQASLYDSSNVLVDYNGWSWNETDGNESAGDSWDDLVVGEYCLTANLWMAVNATSNAFVASDNFCFEIVSGGSGNNSTNQIIIGSFSTNALSNCFNGDLIVNMSFEDTDNITGGQMTVFASIWQGSSNNMSGTNVASFNTTVTFDLGSGLAYLNWAEDLSAMGLANGDYILHLSTTFMDIYSTTFTLGCTGCGYEPSFHTNSTSIWWLRGQGLDDDNKTDTGNGSDTSQSLVAFIGQELQWSAMIGCAMYDTNYKFNMTLMDGNDTIIDWDESIQTMGSAPASGGSQWWTTRVSDSGVVNTTNLSPGLYCVEITVFVEPYGAGDLLVIQTECFAIMSFDNFEGCGNNMTYMEHEQFITGNPFVQQNLVFTEDSRIWVRNFVDCLVFSESYTMTVNVTNNTGFSETFTHNFTINSFGFFGYSAWDTLVGWNEDIDQGNYCSEATIVQTNSDYTQVLASVSTVEDCFAVVASSTNDDWWDNQGNATGSPNNPIMPDVNCTELNNTLGNLSGLANTWNQTDCENGTGFWFDVTVNGTNVTWYDPIYAVGYDYEIISGPNVGSIIVPPGYGDDKFDLYLWQNGAYVLVGADLDATVQYWFTDEGGISSSPIDNEGVRNFSIRGLELSAKLDPDDDNAFVTGMSFVQNPNQQTSLILSMTPITESDEDDDGVADYEDNCMNDANQDQADADGNGVGDVCETDDTGNTIVDGGGINSAPIVMALMLFIVVVYVAVQSKKK